MLTLPSKCRESRVRDSPDTVEGAVLHEVTDGYLLYIAVPSPPRLAAIHNGSRPRNGAKPLIKRTPRL